MLSDQRRLATFMLIVLLATGITTRPAYAEDPPATTPTSIPQTPTPQSTPATPTVPATLPATATAAPPTATPPTATAVPPTATAAPPTATAALPTATAAPPPAAPASPQVAARPGAPTYRIFATREGLVGRRTANGHRIVPRDRFVALPSWRVLSSKGGNEFQVRVTYRGRSVVLPVWDVGPWNTRDEYWSPNRRYSDLPVGMPMAQAAYQKGYNDGRDEFGRRIRLPNGIDIADGAFWDDLGMSKSDWVEVTFLWMGEDVTAAQAQPEGHDEPGKNEPGSVLIDDSGEGYATEAAANWYDGTCGVGGRHSWTYAASRPEDRENSARWSARLGSAGFYEVFAYIPSCGRKATTAAHYRISHEGAVTQVIVNQQASAGRWISLGTYHMDADSSVVELDDLTSEQEDVVVRFDAVKFVPRSDTDPPEARVVEAIPREDGQLLVRWKGSDDIAGIASFDIQVQRLPDGDWTDWLDSVTETEALFPAPEPGAYAFRARARDWAGREQDWRDDPDLTVER